MVVNYPSGESWVPVLGVNANGWVFSKTGEFRAPKKGEWYLSGGIPAAYCAPNDLETPYHIVRRNM